MRCFYFAFTQVELKYNEMRYINKPPLPSELLGFSHLW